MLIHQEFRLFGSPFPARLYGFAALAGALVLDQAHKYWMLEVFGVGVRPPITVAPFLDIVLSWNYGVSYSLFASHGGVARFALLAVQGVIIAGLCVWLWRARNPPLAVGLGLIIGGALGNAADRLFRGAVADFFYLHTTLPVGPLANYVFNVADVAITLGAALLLYEGLVAPPPAPSPGDFGDQSQPPPNRQ